MMKNCVLISRFTYEDFPLRPEPQCLGNFCCIDSKEEKLLSDSYTTSFISIQSRAGIQLMKLNYLLLQLLEEVVTLEVQLISGLCPLVTLKHLKHVVLGESGPLPEHLTGRVVMISLSLLCPCLRTLKIWKETGLLGFRRN